MSKKIWYLSVLIASLTVPASPQCSGLWSQLEYQCLQCHEPKLIGLCRYGLGQKQCGDLQILECDGSLQCEVGSYLKCSGSSSPAAWNPADSPTAKPRFLRVDTQNVRNDCSSGSQKFLDWAQMKLRTQIALLHQGKS